MQSINIIHKKNYKKEKEMETSNKENIMGTMEEKALIFKMALPVWGIRNTIISYW